MPYMLPIQGALKVLRMTPQMDIDDDEDLDDKYDLCVSVPNITQNQTNMICVFQLQADLM